MLVLQCNEISPLKVETVGPTFGKFIPSHNVTLVGKDSHQSQTYSPVSVFESSSSSSGENSWELPVITGKRARSKRQRITSFNRLLLLPFIPTTAGLQKSQRRAAASESDFEVDLSGKLLNKGKRKQRKKDLSLLSGTEMKRSSSQESSAPRKCMHCEVTKTPQWREGPMGPKTLCNACGVRYRSGRLFPEYRPAASPTFVASVHSNCHKKVIEMRNRAIQETCTDSVLTPSSDFLGNCL